MKIAGIVKRIETTGSYVESISDTINKAPTSSKYNVEKMTEINTATEEKTASMEEVTSTAVKLGSLAEEVKQSLVQKI